MNYLLRISTGLLIIFLIIPSALKAEFIFLKDGAILKGTIVSDEPDAIVARVDGRTQNIARRKIMRILYTELKMGKVFIQLRDGTSKIAYIVDEDRTSYICRNDLYLPAEFILKRNDVLFVAEKNPSGLQGEPSSDSIKLSWLPPYGQVKVYNVYMKLKKSQDYKIAGTAKKTSLTISGLSSQTEYYFIVRAIDDADYETNPSNEVRIMTKSSLPEKPVIKVEMAENKDWKMEWNKTEDKDGKVIGYKVYIEKNGEYTLFKETKENSIVIPANTDFDSVRVRSVDNNGDESAAADYRNDLRFQLSFQYWMPTGDTKIFAGNGLGAMADVSKRDLFFNDFELGAFAGYLTFEGKEKIGENRSNVTSLNMYPLGIFSAYRIPALFNRFGLYDYLSFFPKLSAGFLVMDFDYELLDNTGIVEETKSALVFEPFVKGGIFAEAGISRNIFFTVGCEYTYMIDSVSGLGMISMSASAGFRF